MSLLTRAYILEKFGVRLTMGQLATLLAMSEGTIRNQISAETFPIPTYKEGAARYAAYDAVAEYLEDVQEGPRESGRIMQRQFYVATINRCTQS